MLGLKSLFHFWINVLHVSSYNRLLIYDTVIGNLDSKQTPISTVSLEKFFEFTEKRETLIDF